MRLPGDANRGPFQKMPMGKRNALVRSFNLIIIDKTLFGIVLHSMLRFVVVWVVSTIAIAIQSNPNDLRNVYQRIAQQGIENPKTWPDASEFQNYLDYDAITGRYNPPVFGKDGPVGVFCLVEQDSSGKKLMRTCQDIFTSFCDHVSDIINKNNETLQIDFEKYILRSKTLHITVAIFQEHPRLLRDDAAVLWRPIDPSTMQDLTNALSKLRDFPTIQLSLDSIILTADGAMIACFVDDEQHSFHNLRSSCISTAQSVLGELTSRPKNLIHVTLGRILEYPSVAKERQKITELMRHYNAVVLPEKVAALQQADQHQLEIQKVSLLRNTVWLLEDYIEYGSWELQ